MNTLTLDQNSLIDAALELPKSALHKLAVTNNTVMTDTLLKSIQITPGSAGRISKEEWKHLQEVAEALIFILKKDVTLSNFTVDGLI